MHGSTASSQSCANVSLTPMVRNPTASAASLMPSSETPSREMWHLSRRVCRDQMRP